MSTPIAFFLNLCFEKKVSLLMLYSNRKLFYYLETFRFPFNSLHALLVFFRQYPHVDQTKWGKSPQMCWHLKNLSLQQILKMMSKMEENDGYWCFTRILNFGSKTFRVAAFTLSTDLLFGRQQHFQFSTNAFTESDLEKTVDLVFIVPQNFGTKFEIQKKVLTFCWIALVAS